MTIILILLFSVLYGQTVTVDGAVVDKKQNPVENVLAKIANENVVEDSSFTNNLGQYELTVATVGIEDEDPVPLKFSLDQNYPNPFNPSTSIKFTTTSEGSFLIHNILGQEIARSKIPGPGSYTIDWGGANKAGKNVSAGTYLYTVLTLENKKTRKMILIDGGNGIGIKLTGKANSNPKTQGKILNNQFLLSFEKNNLTNLYLPVTINGDTTINQTVNPGPVVFDTIPSRILSVGDSAVVNLNDFVYNDENNLYLPRDSSLSVQDSILKYLALVPDTLETFIDVIDGSDSTLRDSLFFRVAVPYVHVNQPPSMALPSFELLEDDTLRTLIGDMNSFASDPENDVLAFQLISQSNPSLLNLYIDGNALKIDSLQTNGFGIGQAVISVSDGEYSVNDTISLIVNSVNDVPVQIADIPSQVVDEDSFMQLVFSSYVFDVEGDSLSALIDRGGPHSLSSFFTF